MRVVLSAALALGCLLYVASGASAHTYSFICHGGPEELQLALNGTNAWTQTDGGPGTNAKPASGDTVEIDGTTAGSFCNGDIFVNTSGVTFKNHLGTDALISSDIINGMFEIDGAQITIDGIALRCPGCSTTTPNASGLSNFDENGALLLHDGAVVFLENAVVSGSATSGIFAENGSSIRLGTTDGNAGNAVTIAGNGKNGDACPGFGILLTQGSTLESFAATIGGTGTANDGNSQNTCGQILLQSGSSARIAGTSITQFTASLPAVQALSGSSFLTTTNPVPTATTINSNVHGAILLGAVSSAVLNASTISSTGTSVPTIEAAGSSTLTLGGGNTISNTTGGGIVFQIDHSSSLFQVPAHQFGFTDAVETVTGSASVQVQSSMDLGIGLVGGQPSISWSVPAGDCILVQQNSSFRMSGGVAIAGAAPAACTLNGGAVTSTIIIQQESNAFFNVGRGGTDVISGGGGVSCIFAGMPNAHVTGKANISPSGAQPVMIGSWTQAGSATSPGCLGP